MRFIQGVALGSVVFSMACASGPRRIDPMSDESVTTMQADYNEMIEWSQTLTNRMLDDGFLEDPLYRPHPPRMVVSDIENFTDMSQFPKEMVMGRIRASMRSSGKVRFISTYGGGATDSIALDTPDLINDPRFNPDQVPGPGQLSVARLSLRTQFLFRGARTARARQNTYEVRMFVTDTTNGEIVWEGFSDPIAKTFRKRRFGL